MHRKYKSPFLAAEGPSPSLQGDLRWSSLFRVPHIIGLDFFLPNRSEHQSVMD